MFLVAFITTLALSPAPAEQDAQAIYDRGITWQAFYDAADARRELWRSNTTRAKARITPDEVERLQKAGTGLTLLVVAEANCSDSVNTVPFIAELAAKAGVELRIVSKEAGEPLLEHHKTPDGRTATPTVIILRDGRDVGAWVERPSALQEWFTTRTDIRTSERVQRKMSWYAWDLGDSTVAEFLAAVEASRPQ